jgi:hypothetical protein
MSYCHCRTCAVVRLFAPCSFFACELFIVVRQTRPPMVWKQVSQGWESIMKWVAFGLAACLAICGSAVADIGQPLTNGDFSSELEGWGDNGGVTVDNGVAVFGDGFTGTGYLLQSFTIPALATSLSFDYKPLFNLNEMERFSASLLTPDETGALVPTNPSPFPPATSFFQYDWPGSALGSQVAVDPQYVNLADLGEGWTRVTLDLSNLAGAATDALLRFDLTSGFSPGEGHYGSKLMLANVGIVTGAGAVPAPGAFLIGSIGCGLVGIFSRRIRRV